MKQTFYRLVSPVVGIIFIWIWLFTFVACRGKEVVNEPHYVDAPVKEKSRVYTLAIHPLHNPTLLFQLYQPLIDVLNGEVKGAKFKLEASRDYQTFENKIRKKSPEIILPNPFQTLLAQGVGYRVIAMAGSEEDFKGLIVVRKNSKIYEFKDLKGKSISYPSKTALAACIMPQYFLYKHGLNVNTDIRNVYVGSQESSIMNAFLKKSDAAATWIIPWRRFVKNHPKEASEMKVMWETESLINNSVMVREDLPDSVAFQLKRCLYSLTKSKKGQTLLNNISTSAFFSSTDKDYKVVEAFIENFEKKVRKVYE